MILVALMFIDRFAIGAFCKVHVPCSTEIRPPTDEKRRGNNMGYGMRQARRFDRISVAAK